MANLHKFHKFRPVLTLEQIMHLADLVSHSLEPIDVSIKRVLVPLIAKIETGAIDPAYSLSEIHALKQMEVSQRTRYESGNMSAEEETEYESKILGV